MFSFNLLIYNLTFDFYVSIRAFNLPTRAFNLVSRAFSFLTRGFENITQWFEPVTRESEFVTRGFVLVNGWFEFVTYGFEVVSRGFELVIHGSELSTRGLELLTREAELVSHISKFIWNSNIQMNYVKTKIDTKTITKIDFIKFDNIPIWNQRENIYQVKLKITAHANVKLQYDVFSKTYVMRCAIWYHLHNLKNVKNTHGGVLLSIVKLHAKAFNFTKSNTPAWVFFTLACTFFMFISS